MILSLLIMATLACIGWFYRRVKDVQHGRYGRVYCEYCGGSGKVTHQVWGMPTEIFNCGGCEGRGYYES